ncbi:MAG: DinB family protein [Chloroflexi bacterium]|nr:DinB family protein [Chloroflexota bacterium]
MNRKFASLIDGLEANGKELVKQVARLSGAEILTPPAPNEWSIHQALAHLRDTEKFVFLYRTQRILKEVNPKVPSFDQEAYHREHYTSTQPLKTVLKEFLQARRKLVALLRKTSDKDWARFAVHPQYGNISLEWLATHCYNHTLEHMVQVGTVYENKLLEKTKT